MRNKANERICKQLGHKGSFMPVIFEARAFTFFPAKNLRGFRERPSFQQLVDRTNKTLRYDQTAQVLGPSAVIDQSIPASQRKPEKTSDCRRRKLFRYPRYFEILSLATPHTRPVRAKK